MRVLAVCISLAASACVGPRPPAAPAAQPARPIVLVQGFSGFRALAGLEYFRGIAKHYEGGGHLVVEAALPPYDDSAVRAEHLARTIDDVLERTGADRVHLVAHSQGGVDARYAVSPAGLGYGDRVAALVTVSTPHHGTPLADLALRLPAPLLDAFFTPLHWLLSGLLDDDPGEHQVRAALRSLSTTGMAAFNEAVPDHPEVRYLSVATVSGTRSAPVCRQGRWGGVVGRDAPGPHFLPSWLLIAGSLSEPVANDGVVPTHSAVWGEFLGCVAADHAEVVGVPFEMEADVGPPFELLPFYDRILDELRLVDAPSSAHDRTL